MTEKTKAIIRDYCRTHLTYVRGRYTYKYDENTGKFYRCLTDLVGESYLDTEGNPHDYWKEVK